MNKLVVRAHRLFVEDDGVSPVYSTEIRHAVWRRRPEDPRRASSWVIWGDRHMGRAQRMMLNKLLLGAVFAVLLLTVTLGISGFILGVLLAWLFLAIYARPGAREHASLPVLGGETAFPVILDIWKDGRRVGRENGWVAFTDGWLVYEGLRTSFSVRSADVHLGRPQPGVVNFWFPERGAARMTLLTDFMQTNRPAKMGMTRKLNAEASAWRAGDIPEGRPLYPPVQKSLRLLGEGVTAAYAFSILFALVSMLLVIAEMAWVAAPFAALSVVCIVVGSRTLQAMREALKQEG